MAFSHGVKKAFLNGPSKMLAIQTKKEKANSQTRLSGVDCQLRFENV